METMVKAIVLIVLFFGITLFIGITSLIVSAILSITNLCKKKQGKPVKKTMAIVFLIIGIIAILPTLSIVPLKKFYNNPVKTQINDIYGEVYYYVQQDNINGVISAIEEGEPVDGISHNSPLKLACQNRNFAMIECLVENGADVNKVDSSGIPPIYYSIAARGYTDSFSPQNSRYEHEKVYKIVEYLLAHGASLKADNDYQFFLLLYLSEYEDCNTMELIVKSDIDINCTFIGGQNILTYQFYLYSKKLNPDILRLLVDNGADINAKDNYGKIPIDYAREAYEKITNIDSETHQLFAEIMVILSE